MKPLFFCLFYFMLLLISSAHAQMFSFELDQSIKITNENGELSNAWTGGFNSVQISTIDLNGDRQQDLFVFDRTSNKVSTFLNQNGIFRYAPDYEALFPTMENWCLLVDYDNDGRKDIFTATRAGIRVFRNTTPQGGILTFRLFKSGLTVRSTTGNTIRLLPDLTDIPTLADMDNDGDLDIFNFIPLTGQTIEFNKNLSVERYNRIDSLEFEKTTLQWGNLFECSTCNEYFFGNVNCRIERVEHSGHASVALDLNGDNLKDFLLSDVNCTGLTAFVNRGTATSASFNGFMPNFPPSNPVNITSFPAAYVEDIDNDGLRDLIVSPNQFFNDGFRIDFTNSIWFYKNTGTNSTPNFIFQKRNFLQEQTIDLGEVTKPAFADFDADGDLDLFVSNSGQALDGQPFRAKIFLFENIGSQSNPSFRLSNSDYANFSQLNMRFLRISFADINSDGATDLTFSATNIADGRSSVRYLLNTATRGERFSFNTNTLQNISLPSITPFDEPLFADLDNDRDPDLLLARFQGKLQYFENTGNLAFTLRNDSLGNISNNFLKRSLSIALTDFNKNSKPDLVTGDQSGQLQIYLDITDRLMSGALPPLSNTLIYNNLLQRNTNYSFGKDISPAVYGEDIVLGLNGGGLQFLKNKSVITAIENQEFIRQVPNFQLYPNPSTYILTIQAQQEGQIRISNLLGIPMLDYQKLKNNSPIEINVSTWAKGVYIVEFLSKTGIKQVRKFVKD
jgi:hypothetical protein